MEKGNCKTAGNLSNVDIKNRTQSLNVNSLGSKYRILIVIQDDKCEEKSDSLKAPDGNWGWIIVLSSFLIQFIIIGKNIYIVQKFVLLSKIVVEYLVIN